MTTLRIEWLVWRINHRLRPDVPATSRRDIRREVRSHLRAAARDIGLTQARFQFGDIDEVSLEYRNAVGDHHRVRIDAGVRAALIVLTVLLALTFIRVPTFGTMQYFDRYTRDTDWEWTVWRLWHFGGDTTTDTLFEGTVYSYALILFPLVAFALWSRCWRPVATPSSTRPHSS
jgi:hypothetical protein